MAEPTTSEMEKLRGIGMTKNIIDKDGVITEEVRYFILSFKGDVQTFLRLFVVIGRLRAYIDC